MTGDSERTPLTLRLTGRASSSRQRHSVFEPPALNNKTNFSNYECLLLELVVTQHTHTGQGVLCSVPVQQFESAKVLEPS